MTPHRAHRAHRAHRPRGADDEGFTLVELIVTIVLLGIVMGALSAAVVVVLRTQGGIVASTAESHDTRQIVNYLPHDIESGPRRADAYVAGTGGLSALPDSTSSSPGGGCDPDGTGNVLVVEITKGRSDAAARRVAYHLVIETKRARIDRYVCTFDAAASTWATDAVINVADYLDPTATPVATSRVIVENPGDPVALQRVDRVELRYAQRGDVESLSAAPREEPPLASSGICDQEPLSAAQNVAVFVERSVHLGDSATKGALFVGDVLTFAGSSEVAQATPPDPTAPVPPNVGLMASQIDWAASSGTLDVKPHYDAVIGDANFERTDNVLTAPGGSPAEVHVGASATATGSVLPVAPESAFATLRACSDQLAGLPMSCNGGECAEMASPHSVSSSVIQLDLAEPSKATVLNIDASQLAALASATLKWAPGEQPSASQPLIINVRSGVGASVAFSPPDLQGRGTVAEYVLWNFPNADVVNLSGGTLWGTLLAPYAEVTSSADIEGGVISRQLTLDNATLHDVRYFRGVLGW